MKVEAIECDSCKIKQKKYKCYKKQAELLTMIFFNNVYIKSTYLNRINVFALKTNYTTTSRILVTKFLIEKIQR